ncbi:uncharacterized protein LOC128951456 [Oppia nitens]|uniref:uncharacterized protein LOC128951456 n=1 Tax=Oppia nitens TaxID=1686743 RepID=UPI0023D9DAD9|nr:uncharacterized protein LOC128951456 [Oppia nitens]
MKTIIFLAIIVVVVGIQLVSCNLSEKDLKNMKLIMCGECKDAKVKEDLDKYDKCVITALPDEVKKEQEIQKEHGNDQDKCFEHMMKHYDDLKKSKPDGYKKMEECFITNVKYEDIDKCH